LLGGWVDDRDEPAGGALVLVEVGGDDTLYVGGGDLGDRVVEGHVERPVAGGDVFVERAGDGERSVPRVGGGGEQLADGGGDLGVGDAVFFQAIKFGE